MQSPLDTGSPPAVPGLVELQGHRSHTRWVNLPIALSISGYFLTGGFPTEVLVNSDHMTLPGDFLTGDFLTEVLVN